VNNAEVQIRQLTPKDAALYRSIRLEGLKKSPDLQERHRDAIKEMDEFLDESKKKDALETQSQSKPTIIGSA